jgi:hypothetical protein
MGWNDFFLALFAAGGQFALLPLVGAAILLAY